MLKQIRWKKKKIESEKTEVQSEASDVFYDLGTKYYYWESHRLHPNYIEPNHDNLKNEMIDNKNDSIRLKIDQWDALTVECDIMTKANYTKQIVANGYEELMYKIQQNASFTTKHLRALKLYTDFTPVCNAFCSTLRTGNELEIAEFAHMAKLLIECVQCYGSLLNYSKIKTYYRGVGNVFLFQMFVTRFNLPTSTTVDYGVAASRFSGQGNGLV
eukprot:461954_1